MDLIFGNPAGAWALLGLPAVLLIHFFQRRTHRAETSTLFLWEDLLTQSAQGRQFQYLRNSPLLWLQLAAVLLLAWLLAEPRWIRADAVQETVVVLDGSASMRPFADAARTDLLRALDRLARAARTAEWTVLDSDPGHGLVYRGGDRAQLALALQSWQPRSPGHDPGPALTQALELARGRAVVLWVTDRAPVATPPGVDVLSVGHPIDNAGFAGVQVEATTTGVLWRALLINHADRLQARVWHLEAGDYATAPETVRLEPGAAVTLRGLLPAGHLSARLVLDPDAFALDDVVPLVGPQPKPLPVQVAAPPPLAAVWQRLLRNTAGRIDLAEGVAGAQFIAGTVELLPQGKPGWYALHRENSDRAYRPGVAVSAAQALVEGLNWSGLLVRGGPGLPVEPADTVLVWQGAEPLIFLRGQGLHEQLIFNFDLAQANADRLPAFVLLAHRYLDQRRAALRAFERKNVELQQELAVACRPGEPCVLRVNGRELARAQPEADGWAHLRAPEEPGFLQVAQGDEVWLEAAAHFADTGEADFRTARSYTTLGDRYGEVSRVLTRADAWTPLWLCLLAAVLLCSWRIQR